MLHGRGTRTGAETRPPYHRERHIKNKPYPSILRCLSYSRNLAGESLARPLLSSSLPSRRRMDACIARGGSERDERMGERARNSFCLRQRFGFAFKFPRREDEKIPTKTKSCSPRNRTFYSISDIFSSFQVMSRTRTNSCGPSPRRGPTFTSTR